MCAYLQLAPRAHLPAFQSPHSVGPAPGGAPGGNGGCPKGGGAPGIPGGGTSP